MHIRETVTVAIDALRSNKLRAALTSLGVIIGSASIVLVVTVALTSKKYVLSQIEAVGSNLLWVELVRSSDKPQPLSYELTIDDMNTLKAGIPNVAEAAGIRELPMAVVVPGGTSRAVNLIGVTVDMQMRSKFCLITGPLAERVFGTENPVGKNIRMGELTFTVIGVFRERASTFGQSEVHDYSVIIPFTLMKYYTGTDVLRTMYVQAARPESVESVQRQMAQLLRSRHPAEAEYDVQTLTAILDVARKISLGLTVVLVIIAAIALLVSGIGIMNIMLVTVTERTREIGIRKAIGAAQREILYQFLVESFLISGGGAVIGILIGLAMPVVAQYFLPGNLRVPVSPLSVVIAFVVSCSTGLFFGYLPANQAASLQPVESLRYE